MTKPLKKMMVGPLPGRWNQSFWPTETQTQEVARWCKIARITRGTHLCPSRFSRLINPAKGSRASSASVKALSRNKVASSNRRNHWELVVPMASNWEAKCSWVMRRSILIWRTMMSSVRSESIRSFLHSNMWRNLKSVKKFTSATIKGTNVRACP